MPNASTSKAEQAPLLPPDTERYQFTRFIARGGMGEVYEATDARFQRTVAIKVLRQRLGISQEAFCAEADLVARLSHPGIVPIHDAGELSDGRPFFVMKLVEGETFEEVLNRTGPDRPNLTRQLQYFEQICQTVAYAHSKIPPLLHRDLKPQNVMLGAFGEVQVMDWGIAKYLGESEAHSSDTPIPNPTPANSIETTVGLQGSGSVREETGTGIAKGTWAYMPPEQARGEKRLIGPATDVFALGGILCKMLAGKATFVGTDAPSRAMAGDLSETFARLDQCGSDPELVALAKRLLEPDPTKRIRDAQAAAEAVREYQDAVQSRLKQAEMERARAETQAFEQRKRRKVQLALVASTLVLLIGGVAAGWWYDHQAALQRERLTAALQETEEALRHDDALAAEVAFETATEHLPGGSNTFLRARFERCNKDLKMMIQLDRIDDFRRTPVAQFSLKEPSRVHYERSSRRGSIQIKEFDWTIGASRLTVSYEFPDVKQVVGQWDAAFAEFGIISAETAPGEAASRIDESLIRDRLLMALDTRLTLDPSATIAAILTIADPDIDREALRQAVLNRNLDQQRAVAGRMDVTNQPERFALAVGQLSSLSITERQRYLNSVYKRNPGNFLVLMELGALWPINQQEGATERIGWYRAALAVRPTNTAVWRKVGIALDDKKDSEGAIAAFRQAVRIDPKDPMLHFSLGITLRRMKDLEGAIAAYREVIRLNPQYVRAYYNLGNTLYDKKDLNGAIAAYRGAIQLNPNDPDAHHNLADALDETNDPDGAIAAYQEAIRLNPKNPKSHFNLGITLRHKKDLDGAISAYREAIRLDPKHVRAHNALGNALEDKKDLDGAIAAFQEAIRLDPKYAWAHCNLGIALRNKKDLNGAIVAFKEAIHLDPIDPDAHYNLGIALRHKKDLEGAIAAFREAHRLDPNDPDVHNALGNALDDKNDLDGAIAAYKEAIRIDPINYNYHYNLGNSLRHKNDLDGAIAAYKEAIRLNPNDPDAHYQLGNLLYDKKDLDGAVAAYKQAIRLNPNDPDAHHNLADALDDKNDLDGAIAAYKEAIRLDPSNPASHFNLGITLRHKKDLDGAIAAYREAIRLDPKYLRALISLGNALDDKNDPVGAIAAYRAAIRLDPSNPSSYYNLGIALRHQNDLAGATAAYKECIRLNPKDPYVHNALGLALNAKKDFEAAIAAYKEAIQLDPKYAKPHLNLGIALYLKNDPEGAIAAYREAIRLDPKYVLAHSNLAFVLCEKKDFEGAVSAANETIRLDPNFPQGYFALSRIYICRGEPSRGLKILADAAHKNPQWITDINTGFRYSAACRYILASELAGKTPLSELERASLRTKALEWLNADLKERWKMSAEPKNMAVVHEKMQFWLEDGDFTTMRDPTYLKQLPATESKDWEKLWDSVRKLQRQTAELLPVPKIREAP